MTPEIIRKVTRSLAIICMAVGTFGLLRVLFILPVEMSILIGIAILALTSALLLVGGMLTVAIMLEK